MLGGARSPHGPPRPPKGACALVLGDPRLHQYTLPPRPPKGACALVLGDPRLHQYTLPPRPPKGACAMARVGPSGELGLNLRAGLPTFI